MRWYGHSLFSCVLLIPKHCWHAMQMATWRQTNVALHLEGCFSDVAWLWQRLPTPATLLLEGQLSKSRIETIYTPRTSTLSLPLQPHNRKAISLEAGCPANQHPTTQLPRPSGCSFPRPAQPSNPTWPTAGHQSGSVQRFACVEGWDSIQQSTRNHLGIRRYRKSMAHNCNGRWALTWPTLGAVIPEVTKACNVELKGQRKEPSLSLIYLRP